MRAERSSNPATARATRAMEAARPRAESDPERPIYHITSPAQWMNDPNGPIWWKGWYHLFYQLDPFTDAGGVKYWGHVRSRNLVRWEHLPIALGPSHELGEDGIWSGCATVNGSGQPMAFYTSVTAKRNPKEHAEQWAALGDEDLLTWTKHPANPILTDALHGDVKIYDWRDPYIFHDEGATYLVLGGHLAQEGGNAVVPLYRAENAELTRWTYLGSLFENPDDAVVNHECPNFFPLGGKWVLLVSPHDRVLAYIGQFDRAHHRFIPESRRVLDGGTFYAPNTMAAPDGRLIMWGWIGGYPKGRGWNGCLSLPRAVELTPNGELRQEPIPELETLRTGHTGAGDIALNDSSYRIVPQLNKSSEIVAMFEPGTADSWGLRLSSASTSDDDIVVRVAGETLIAAGNTVPFHRRADEKTVTLHVFLDRSALEVFADGRATVATAAFSGDALGLDAFAEGGSARVRKLDIWEMGTIW